MKNIKYLLILTFILSQSCKKVLDRKPLDKIAGDKVWTDEALINAYVTNLYSRLPFFPFDPHRGSNYSDQATRSTGNFYNVTQGVVDRDNEGSGMAYWDYEFIRDCNIFLEKIGTTTLNKEIKADLEGQVRVIRAWSYFEMEKRYGGVPLVDVVIDPYAEASKYKQYTKRSKEVAIADFIDSELTKATDLLSGDPNSKGKINKWTALAFKARAMLWAASIAKFGKVELNGLVGIPSSRAEEFYTKAANAADAVIRSGKYELYNKYPDDKTENYRQIFLDENNSEVIFEKIYDGVNLGHSWDAWVAPPQFAKRGGAMDPTLEFILRYENIDGSDSQPLFGSDHLYKDGYAPFKNKDPRLHATVFFQGDLWGSGVVQTYEGLDPANSPNPEKVISSYSESYQGVPTVGADSRNLSKDDFSTNSGFIVKKYVDEGNILVPEGLSKTNWIEVRLAEMYLIKAEAEFELDNKQKAAKALNYTRERAGISKVDANTITRKKVRMERTSELAFEGFRYWDLRRWRIAASILNHRFQGLRIIYHYASKKYYFLPFNCEAFTRSFSQRMYYNPITTSRINNNPDLVENPLY